MPSVEVMRLSTIICLIKLKTKASLRNIFKKPLSAIFTTLAILSFGGMFIYSFLNPSAMPISFGKSHGAISVVMLYGIFMMSAVMFSSNSALIYENDANFLFSAPLTKTQVLCYILLDSIKGSFISALMISVFIYFMVGVTSLTPVMILVIFLALFLAMYLFSAFITYLYLAKIQFAKGYLLSKLFITVMLLFIVGILGYEYFSLGLGVKEAAKGVLKGQLFNVIPIFGWCRWAIISVLDGDILLGLLPSLTILIGFTILLTTLVVKSKADFYEKAAVDAINISNIVKSNKEGKEYVNASKVSRISFSYKYGGAALFSKNLAEIRKNIRTWLLRDMITIIIYLAITKLFDLDSTFFQFMMLFYVMTLVSSDSWIRELKKPYIYLIPDDPFKKLLYLVGPSFIKTSIVCFISSILGAIVFSQSIGAFFLSFTSYLCYGCIFISGSILSLRIMKNRSSAMVEQFLRMLVLLISILPSVLVILAVGVMIGFDSGSFMSIGPIVSNITNILVSILIIYLCRNLLVKVNINDN